MKLSKIKNPFKRTKTPPPTVIKELDSLSTDFLNGARSRDFTILERCIFSGVNVNCQDVLRGNSALHLVLSHGCFSPGCVNLNIEQCLKILLMNRADPNLENLEGKTPLHIVVQRFGPTSIAKILIDYGATLVKGNGLANGSLAKKIALKQPQIASALLDSAVSLDREKTVIVDDALVEAVKLDWRYLVYNAPGTKGKLKEETKFLNDILHADKETRRIILTHPLVKAFLHKKRPLYWKHFGLFHCIWILATLILYLVFIWRVYIDVCKYAPSNSTDSSNGSDFTRGTIQNITQCNLSYEWIGIGMLTAVLFALGPGFLEWRKLWAIGPVVYAKQWQNYPNFVMLSCVMVTLLPAVKSPMSNTFYLGWEYGFAALGMIVGSLSILIQLMSIPFVALNLEMLFKIFWKIVFATWVLSPLLLGFFLAFQILVPNSNIGPFQILTMVVSDTDYESMREPGRGSFYDIAVYVTFAAFIVVIVIVLLNFLVGLAVNDIQQLRESAKATNLSNQVRSYYLMDTVYGTRRRNNRAVTKGGRAMSYVFYPLNEKERTSLPEDIKLELLEIARSRCSHLISPFVDGDTMNNNMMYSVYDNKSLERSIRID